MVVVTTTILLCGCAKSGRSRTGWFDCQVSQGKDEAGFGPGWGRCTQGGLVLWEDPSRLVDVGGF